jgi:hypothetical protein
MDRGETFARFPLGFDKYRGTRVASLAVLVGLSLASIVVVRQLNPERKLLLFDLGIGLIFAAALYVAARWMIVAEAGHQRRSLAAVLIGVTTATAALGVYAVTASGKPLGLDKLPQLVVLQVLGAIGGGGLGFLLAFFAAAIVAVARRFFVPSSATIDGLCVGGLTGLTGGLVVAPLPHLGAGFVAASVVACAICGFRAARLYALASSPKHEMIRPPPLRNDL